MGRSRLSGARTRAQCQLVFPMSRSLHSKWGRPPGRCELIEAVRAANGSRKKLRVCRPYKQSVGPRDTLHIPGICALFSESRLVHIFQGVCPTISVQFPALEKLSEFGNADEYI